MFLMGTLLVLVGLMAVSPAFAQEQYQLSQNESPLPDVNINQDQQNDETPNLPDTATNPTPGISSQLLMWIVLGLLAVVVVVALVAMASRGGREA